MNKLDIDTIRQLLNAKADVNLKNEQYGKSALDAIRIKRSHGSDSGDFDTVIEKIKKNSIFAMLKNTSRVDRIKEKFEEEVEKEKIRFDYAEKNNKILKINEFTIFFCQ